jgi:hypothetical protein
MFMIAHARSGVDDGRVEIGEEDVENGRYERLAK